MAHPGRGPDLLTSGFAAGTLALVALGVTVALAPDRAAHLARRVAGRFGHAASAREVGLRLRDENDARATEWLTLAADGGDPVACVVVADDLVAPPGQEVSGRVLDEAPEPPEVAQARALYARAAASGDPLAAQRLGVMLVDGRGGPADPVEGARWLRFAADHAERVDDFDPEPRRLVRAGGAGWLGAFEDPLTCLGRLHELGLGAAQDDAAAADLYRAALAQAGSHEARLGGARTWLLDLLERRPDLRRPGDPTRWRGCRLPAR